uniref:Copper chaperone n=1 Tax=Cannabis sativa TaxID=3483 RepID=A0A803NWV3_CANSA
MAQTVVLKVGMSCQGCVGAVKRVLGKLEEGDSERQCASRDSFSDCFKTGKKTAYWEEAEPAKPAEAEAKPAEGEAKPAETESKPAETVAAA